MGQKQKILLTLIIIIIAILAWQFYIRFLIDSPHLSLTSKIGPTLTMPTVSLQKPTAPSISPTPATQTTVNNMTATAGALTAPPLPSNEQEIYTKLNNKYLLLKMQRQLAEEQANLLAARLRIVALNQQMNKSLGGQSPCATDVGYQLIDIDCQNNKAILLTKSGQLIEVSEGMILADQSKILNVATDSVVIQQGANSYRLNFYNAVLMKPSTSQQIPASGAEPLPISKEIMSSANNNPSSVTSQVMQNKISPPLKNVAAPEKKIAKIRTASAKTTANKKVNNPKVVVTPTVSPNVSANDVTASTEAIPLAPQIQPQNDLTPPPLISKPKQPLALTPEEKTKVSQLENSLTKEQNKATLKILNKDELHLLTLPQTYYTLQIYGSYKLNDIDSLAKRNKLANGVYVFHTYYLGKDWYVLIYGIYKTEQEANAAIATLPRSIRNLKPWVRNIGSVQDAIKSLS